MSTNTNHTCFLVGVGTTLRVSERPNSVGTLHGRAGFWFNASVQCNSLSGFASFADLKLYVDTADRETAERKVGAIQGHIAQGHKVFVEIDRGADGAAGWPVSGIKRWSTKDEDGRVQSWGTDFMVNLPAEALRFFAKGVARREETEAPAETAAAQAQVAGETAEPVAAETVAETAEAPATKKRGTRKQRAAAGQPALLPA